MNNECIFHEGYDEDDCPLCNMEIEDGIREIENQDFMKWSSLVGFILEMKDKGNYHFKGNISHGNKDILTLECGDDYIEIDIS